MAAKAKADNRVPVTMRAVVQRINRKLRPDEEVLKKTRGMQAYLDLGDYYVLDWNRNNLVDKNVDPESMARELGVLLPYERVVED